MPSATGVDAHFGVLRPPCHAFPGSVTPSECCETEDIQLSLCKWGNRGQGGEGARRSSRHLLELSQGSWLCNAHMYTSTPGVVPLLASLGGLEVCGPQVDPEHELVT